MERSNLTTERISKLVAAFQSDNYSVDPKNDVIVYNNNNTDYIGIKATHNTAVIGTSSIKKKVYYTEGDPYTIGYLTGKLAESDVSRMCTDFNENIVFDFINWQIKDETLRKILGKIVEDIINEISQNIYPDVPDELKQELNGLLDGCKAVNSKTKVDSKSLWVLNVGIDAILSYVYTGILPYEKAADLKAVPGIKPEPAERLTQGLKLTPDMFKIPIMCNGFSIMGTDLITKNKFHYMGRDFMFSTADVFQDTAAMFIRRTLNDNYTISVAAPGMIGTIAGINKYGVGVGVDMSPASNCNPNRPGLNSLLLTRWSIENGNNCVNAAKVITDAQRGVTWDYILADGINDSACIIEAGESTGKINFLKNVESWVVDTITKVYPGFQDLINNPSVPVQNGAMIRWNNYQYPSIYQTFNESLINEYKKRHKDYIYNYNANDFCENTYLNIDWTEKYKNCPGPYYFAPKRETSSLITLMTNHFVIPEMRLLAMNPWTELVAKGNLNDIQWRYDELNNELLNVSAKGYVTYEEAKNTIDFLSPAGKFQDYYNPKDKQGNRKPLNEVQVHGSVSIFDLKELTIESHYGYYSDEWIKLCLKKYIAEPAAVMITAKTKKTKRVD